MDWYCRLRIRIRKLAVTEYLFMINFNRFLIDLYVIHKIFTVNVHIRDMECKHSGICWTSAFVDKQSHVKLFSRELPSSSRGIWRSTEEWKRSSHVKFRKQFHWYEHWACDEFDDGWFHHRIINIQMIPFVPLDFR